MQRVFLIAALFCAALAVVSFSGQQSAVAAEGDRAEASTSKATAKELVEAALIAETKGDNAARARALTTAWLAEPELPEANWHLGRVRVEGEWLSLDDAELAAASDAQLEEYRELRDATANAKLVRALARWCSKAGLNDAAKLHYAQLLARGDADAAMREEAVERLDLQLVGGKWVTREEHSAWKQEAKAVEEAFANWRPRLKRLQVAIDGDDAEKRRNAIAALGQLGDPTIIPVLESFLSDGQDRFQEEAVRHLGSFPQFDASDALVRFAILSNFPLVRKQAADALNRRPLHESCPQLIEALRSTLQSRFQVTADRAGNVHYGHIVLQEGPDRNRMFISRHTALMRLFQEKITYSNPEVRESYSISMGDDPWLRAYGKLQAAKLAAARIQSQVRAVNAQAAPVNDRVFAALETITGQDLDRTPSAWRQWWETYNEYYWPKPTQYVYQNHWSFYDVRQLTLNKLSCFARGTLVRTETGLRPIEDVKVGDRVVAQDQDTAELAYKLVLRTTLRPPSKIVRIQAGDEAIKTTLGHPIWVSGHGWKMTKELEEGDLLHSLGGAVPVEKVDRLAVPEEAYNLVVDGFNTYFVGQQGLLVHDNEFRKPTMAIVPGLVKD